MPPDFKLNSFNFCLSERMALKITSGENQNAEGVVLFAVHVEPIVRHFILHYLVIFNSKSSSIDTNFDAELIKDAAVS